MSPARKPHRTIRWIEDIGTRTERRLPGIAACAPGGGNPKVGSHADIVRLWSAGDLSSAVERRRLPWDDTRLPRARGCAWERPWPGEPPVAEHKAPQWQRRRSNHLDRCRMKAARADHASASRWLPCASRHESRARAPDPAIRASHTHAVPPAGPVTGSARDRTRRRRSCAASEDASFHKNSRPGARVHHPATPARIPACHLRVRQRD